MARIKIDVERQIDKIDRNIFGGFAEHLGRCIYGGIYEPGSPLSNDKGYRVDVLEALKKLNMPIMRWPGGNFVSNYHWMDAIGKNRKKTIELAWESTEPNTFGTDEFLDYSKDLNTEPYIAVNMGTGTIEEVAAWAEYCNGDKDTRYANMRRENGHEDPYKVKYWALGNEVHGSWQIGHKEAKDYAYQALEFSKMIKWISPYAKTVACGCESSSEWNYELLKVLYGKVDYISIHSYRGNANNEFKTFMGTSMFIENLISKLRGLINSFEDVNILPERYLELLAMGYIDNSASVKNSIVAPKIAFDEWNVWYRATTCQSMMEEIYNFEDALCVALFMNTFIRNADIVKMANIAQIVNVIAPIFTSKEGLFLQTIYYPFMLLSNHTGDISLDTYLEDECYNFQHEDKDDSGSVDAMARITRKGANKNGYTYLDVSTSYNSDTKEVILSVVNRNETEAVKTSIESQNNGFVSGEVFELYNDDIKAINSFENSDNVKVVEKSISNLGMEFTYEFPPHSYTLIKIKTN